MKIYHLLLLLTFGIFAACDNDEPTPDCTLTPQEDARFFEFEHMSSGKTFIAWTSRADVLADVEAELALDPEERIKHINGPIARLPDGCENVNGQWSWYHEPNEWVLAEISIEVCDGNPDYVEANLDEFIRIGGYCPWGSRLLREIQMPF